MKTFIALLLTFSTMVSIHASEPYYGMLVDCNGKPIKGAKVYVHNPKDYAKSNKNGEFCLTDLKSTDTLRVKVNKKIYEIPVNDSKGMRIIVGDMSVTGRKDQEEVEAGNGSVNSIGYFGRSNNLYRRNGRH